MRVAEATPDAVLIGGIIRKVAGLPFVKAVCLPQSMAAMWMLRRRGLSGTLYLGARHNTEKADPGLEAHSWVSVGGRNIVGGRDVSSYSVVGRFA